jgi:glutathione synthase
MKHLFLIDPIEKLTVKKDSSLFWAITLQKMGHEVYLFFRKDLYVTNLDHTPEFEVTEFEGKLEASLYVDHISLLGKTKVTLHPKDILHMRIDPPFNDQYLHTLWLLHYWENRGQKITNSPKGIFLNQEKLTAYQKGRMAIPSYVGQMGKSAMTFLEEIKSQGYKEFILKPLNSFSGIGVFKFSLLDNFSEFPQFKKNMDEIFVLQPFLSSIYQGEIRTIYWKGSEIGTILKKPKPGSFLANVAQGGNFELCKLDPVAKKSCDEVALELAKDGVDLIAYDVLDGKISEINITCPGLLVEVSHALGRNLCAEFMSDGKN